MALLLIKPGDLPVAASVDTDAAVMVQNGEAVERATPQQVVDAGRPIASEVEAVTGTDNTKAMTPLTVRQAIDADTSGAVIQAQEAADAAASSALDAESAEEQTGLDALATAADRVQTGLDATATAADRIQTGLDAAATGADATATAADRVQTGLDAAATAADRVQTGLDAAATAADRVQTGLDAASAAASAASIGRTYENRADFVADTYAPADGVTVSAGGLTYVRDAAATTIPDLSGWLPFGEMEPGHFATFAAYLTATDYSLSTRFEGDINVATFENTKGITFEGNGRIFTPVTGGSWQRNSYSPQRTLHMGHEYIEAPYTYMALGQGSSGTFQVRIFGDSTATDDYGGALPSNVIRRAFQERGIPNFELFNEAVSGTAWDDCNAVASLTSNTALIFLKYGVNDPANGVDLESRLAALYTNMDTVLSGIRADADGDLASLAIILVGPNSTSDTPNNRDEQWYEKVRGIYVAMARKHHCAYFDTYGQFLDSRPAANIYMDDPYADGRAIHPTNQFNARIWGKIMDEFFSRGQIALYATNLFTNEGDISGTVTAATLPSVYNFGTFINRATTGDGWPQDGFVITTKNPDGGVMQEVWNFGSTTRVTKRTANTGSDSWNGWSGVGVALTLSNSWVVQGAPWQSPIATKTADGTVVVEGLVNSGTTTAGTVIATLPAGYRPTADSLFVVAANGGFVTLSVEAGGSIKAFTAADGTFTSLSGICFSAA